MNMLGMYNERMYDTMEAVSDCPYCGLQRIVVRRYDGSYEGESEFFIEHVNEKEAVDKGCFTMYFAFESEEDAIAHANMHYGVTTSELNALKKERDELLQNVEKLKAYPDCDCCENHNAELYYGGDAEDWYNANKESLKLADDMTERCTKLLEEIRLLKEKVGDLEKQLEEEKAARYSAEYEAKRVEGMLKVELNNWAQSKCARERKERELAEKEARLDKLLANPNDAWDKEKSNLVQKLENIEKKYVLMKQKFDEAKEALR